MEESIGTQGAPPDDGRRVGYLELLRENRGFRQLWLGQIVSQLGDWFNTIAVYTLVLQLTGSGRAVGLVLVARFLPTVVIGPLAGVVADRFDRRRIMIISDVLRAAVVLGFLFIRRPDQLWLVYVLTVLQLLGSTFFEPAKSASIPSLVSGRELMTANAISSVTWSAMLTLGAAIGGFVTGWFGTGAAFIIDSLSFVLSALLIVGVRLPRRLPRARSKLTMAKALGFTDTLEGIRYVRQRPRVMALLALKPAWGLGGGVLTLLAVFGEKIFPIGGDPAFGIGVLYAVRGVGTAVGPIAARLLFRETRRQMQLAIGVSFLFGGVFYMAFGVAGSFAVAAAMVFLAHMGGSLIWIYATVLLQASVVDDFRGRVFAAELTLLTLTLAASNYVTGELLDRFGYSPRAVTVGLGAIFILPGIIWFATKRWWDRDGRQTVESGRPSTQ